MDRDMINVYLCNFKDRDCNCMPWCGKQMGSCYSTPVEEFAQLRNNGEPIIISQIPLSAFYAEITEEDS